MIAYQAENFGREYDWRNFFHINYDMPPHIHQFSEIAYTLEGVTTAYISGKKYLIPAGHMLLVLPNQIHAYTPETSSHMQCAVFSGDFVPLFFRALQGMELADPVADFSDQPRLLRALSQATLQNPLQLGGLLHLVCDRFLQVCPRIPACHGNHSLLHDAVEYISQNFRQDITLQTIAAELGCNEKYLSSSLHALTQTNFRSFLASYRIEAAKQLLAGTGAVTDIAFECGFSSLTTFNRTFLQFTGMTPSAWRRSHAGAPSQ